MGQKLVNRIAFKLVFWLIAVSSILTFLSTFTQVYLDYRIDIMRVTTALTAVASKHLPDVARTVTAGVTSEVNTVLGSLVEDSGLDYAAVLIDEKVVWEQGRKLSEEHIKATFPLSPSNTKVQLDASLEVLADTGPVWQDLKSRSVQMLITNGIKIFLIAGFMALVFQYLVTRHLEFLVKQIRLSDFSQPFSPFNLDRKSSPEPDELDLVVSDLNDARRRAREAYDTLARNEQRLLLFFDSTEEAIVGVDLDGVCSFANDASLAMLGLSEYEEIIGKDVHTLFIHKSDRNNGEAGGKNLIFQSMEEGRSLRCENGHIVIGAKKELLVSLRSYPVFKEGSVTGAIAFMNDNSETRKLRQERELLSEAVEQVPVMIIITDSEDLIEFANPGAEQLTGFTQEELLGKSVLKFNKIIEDGYSKVVEIKKKLHSGKKWEGILKTRSKKGVPLTLFSVISPVFNDKNEIVHSISVSREISYEIGLQNEVVNAKKMEAVGRLSSSFAHEFGNPLFGVRSVLKDISDRIEFSKDDHRLLELAQDECDRMTEMVKEFRQLYRDSTSEKELQDIDLVIKSVIRDVSSLMKAGNVKCSVVPNEIPGGFIVNKNKLSLVVRNIVVNAIESMALNGGGNLRISRKKEGSCLILRFADDGEGVKKEHSELIFEPFFSTKPEVEGAGLGLSVAYGTMTSLGGTITFGSSESGESFFNVHIPIH